MNHIYRSIWNATLGCWVAAPETASTGGKASRSRTTCRSPVDAVRASAPRFYLRQSAQVWLAVLALCAGGNALAALGNLNLTSSDPVFSLNTSDIAESLSGEAGTTVNLGIYQLSFGSDGSNQTFSGGFTGIGRVVKVGVGTQTLNGNSTFSGGLGLNAGTLVVGSSFALGTGALTVGGVGGTLNSSANMTLNNSIALNANLTAGGANPLTLGGVISGGGNLIKDGTSTLTLTGNNTYTGTTSLNAGTLIVGSNSAIGSGGLNAAGGTTLDTNTAVTLHNNILLTGALNVGGSADLSLSGTVTGAGSLVKNGAANLTLNSTNTFSGGTTLNAGTLTLGNANGLGSGGLTVGGASTLDTSTGMSVGNNITLNAGLTLAGSNTLNLSGVIDGVGSLTKDGFGDLTLSGNNTFTGALNIASGSLTTVSSGALGNTSGANISTGASLYLNSSANLNGLSGSGSVQIAGGNTLTVGGVSNTSTFDGDLGGNGGLTKVGTGTLNLNGLNSITGNTSVNGGTLNLTGSLASSQLNVNNGATLTGTGAALGTITINSGGRLALSSGNTLSTSSLILTANSNVDASLATPSTSSLMNIGGDLKLDGNLNVTDAGGFGVGVYRLFNYIGALTGNGLTVASVPVGYALGDLVVQTGAPYQVNLVVSAPNTNLRFWDGSQTNPNSTVDGGSGIWNAGGTNWTNSNGTQNSTWAGDFAVFQGTAGTVSVNGTQLFTGMQFVTDGYNVVNGTAGLLTAVNGTDGTTAIRVDPGVTATVGANIDGSGILKKLDAGTLVLNGANSYSGGTQLNGGTLVVGSNTALGTGALIANAGTQLDSNTAVTLANATTLNGDLTLLGSNALTLNGVISGTGGLIKTGTSTLTLNGNNAYSGTTSLNAGTLIVGSSTALGTGALNAAGGTSLDASTAVSLNNTVNLVGNLGIGGTADLTLAGVVNGVSNLIKNGAANLTLSGNNYFLGSTILNAGTLTAGSNSALGLGNLTVAGASALDSNSALSLGNNVVLNANLSNTGSNNLTLGGAVSGAGGLIKDGASNLTLNGVNTYGGGTTLNAGTLSLGTGASLGSGALTVAGASTLDNTAPLVLANNLNVNANLALAGNNNLTLGGIVAGAGTLTKNGLSDLTLFGNNTFSGTFDVQAGSLTTLGNSALGSNAEVNLGATAALNLGGSGSLASLTGSGTALIGGGNTLSIGGNNSSSIFGGVLTGTGELTKLGTGALTLSGASTYSGGTTINGGNLVAANNNALGTGNVTVGSGAALEVTSGTALAVGGNLTFGSNSTYRVYADPNSGTSSHVDVAGTATLDGGVLHIGTVSNAQTDFQVGKTYTILTANNVIGTFGTASSDFAYLDTKLDYSTANQVDLKLQRKTSGSGNLGFADLANTPNQGGAARSIESLPTTHALYQFVETLPAGTPAQVFSSLSGDTHSTVSSSVNMLSAQAPNISQQHLRSNMTAGFRAGAPIAQSDGPLPASAFPSSKALPAWVEVVGHWQKMDGNSNTPGVKQNTTGLFLGADEEVGNSGWRVGGSVGYTNADAKVSSRDASADISSYSAAVYTGKGFSHAGNRINVIGGLAYTKHSIESERSVAALNQNLKADYSAHTAQLFAEVGYAMGQYDKQGFEPFVGITLGEQRSNSFKESGGFAALSSESSRDTLASTTLGVRAHSDFVLAGKDTRVRASLGVRHAWGSLNQNRTMAFEGSNSFTVAGAPLARNTALVGLQAEMALSRYSALVLGYNGEYGSGSRDQSASVKVRWAY